MGERARASAARLLRLHETARRIYGDDWPRVARELSMHLRAKLEPGERWLAGALRLCRGGRSVTATTVYLAIAIEMEMATPAPRLALAPPGRCAAGVFVGENPGRGAPGWPGKSAGSVRTLTGVPAS